MDRFRIKLVGASGSGVVSLGMMITEALTQMGFYVVADREYPSVIKGGHACFTINIAREKIHGLSEEADVMLMIDRPGFEEYHHQLKDGGVLLHAYDKIKSLSEITEEMESRGIQIIGMDGRKATAELGGRLVMQNVIVLGMFWKLMGYDPKILEDKIERRFKKKKPQVIPVNIKCLELGYKAVDEATADRLLDFEPPSEKREQKILAGNQAIALGSVHCGVRSYFAYPMSPASSILTYLAQFAEKSGMVVKQAEDEITAAQLSIGAMWMGTRAFTATSGGGFDLMTESVSLAGIIECPMVIVIAQRPGPATGLPTWTCQGDLDLAVHGGHGEYPRIVMAVSDSVDAFEGIQHAFNLAEEFQSPVILLTEKQIAETRWSIEPLKQNHIPIKRGLVPAEELENLKNEDRFKITENGLSKRWLPGQSDAYYFANGDEHWEDGTLTEDGDEAREMIAKRMRKEELIRAALPQPERFGPETADISFIGWGSSKNIMIDTIKNYEAQGKTVNYLHLTYLHPLRTEEIAKFFEQNSNVHLIEGNFTGQLGNRIEAQGFEFQGRLLKWNGRSFFLEDLTDYIENKLS